MSQFVATKSFGPKISLTDGQIEKLTSKLNAAGLTCFVENCWTGSCYVMVGLPDVSTDIDGDAFVCGDMGNEIAKIRLSGHDEGARQDSTHNCVGPKKMCLEGLKRWSDELIARHSEEALQILSEAGLSVEDF